MIELLLAVGEGTDVTNLAQYGVLGVIVVLFIMGKIVPGSLLEQREQEIKTLREENHTLRAAFEDKVIPALVRSTDVLTHYVEGREK